MISGFILGILGGALLGIIGGAFWGFDVGCRDARWYFGVDEAGTRKSE